jgi:putative CocE/NonD family hydrolase
MERAGRARRILAAVVGAALAVPLVLVTGAVAPTPALAAPTGYVKMSDGTYIAVNVRLPKNYVAGKKYPTIFEMSGYDGGSANGGTLAKDFGLGPLGKLGLPIPIDDSRQLTDVFNGEYVTVHASVRGTGCSSGEFDLFSWRSALDGKELIDNWIPTQPWSNGDVGIVGHSYGGITGFMIAETQPTHLKAASLSGLIDDVYRALVYPGGVSNYGFPLAWTGGIRPAYDIAGGLLPGILRPQRPFDDPNRQLGCLLNLLGKSRTIVNEPLIRGLSDVDGPWYQDRSLITRVDKINVPMHITGAYQDEQTGPRGQAHLFEKVRGVPKRLILTNGDHNTESTAPYGVPEIIADRKAWLDQFVRGVPGGFGPAPSVTVFFETHKNAAGTLTPNGRLDSGSFPLSQTQFTDWYLRGDGTLSTEPPTTNEANRFYVHGTKRQFWSYQAGGGVGPPITTAEGPDELTWRTAPMTEDTAIAGPIAATLFAKTTVSDTEFFVEVVDEGPDGSVTYLQRGLLKASHVAVDDAKSDKTGDGRIYRPFHPHTNPQQIAPNQGREYLIEVWPVGHVFRAGHRIAVKVHSPPFVDSFYVYVPRTLPGVNTILSGPGAESRIMLPMVPVSAIAGLGPPRPCGGQEAVRCVANPG